MTWVVNEMTWLKKDNSLCWMNDKLLLIEDNTYLFPAHPPDFGMDNNVCYVM